MATWIYARVSTSHQDFAQQLEDIKAYGVDPDNVDGIVEEHESGGKSYTDRKFQQLLNRCKPGDTIFAASTDRLGRNFVDMIRLMNDAKERGITVVACKQNVRLDADDLGTKILLTVTAIIDEDERKRIRHRVKNGVTVAREQIKKDGSRITKKGTVQEHWGNAKGCDMSAANEASCRAKQDAAIRWREQSKAVKFVRRKRSEGWGILQITEELGKLYDENAPTNTAEQNPYSTPTGCKPSKGTVSKWCRETNTLVA